MVIATKDEIIFVEQKHCLDRLQLPVKGAFPKEKERRNPDAQGYCSVDLQEG